MLPILRTPIRKWINAILIGIIVACASACLSRSIRDQDIVGKYEANADWGKSMLVLSSDHTFDQTAFRNDGTQTKIKGTWQFNLVGSIGGIVVFKPFLDVAHDHKGELVDGGAPSISRTWTGSLVIAADPD